MHLAKALGLPDLDGCHFGIEVEVEGMHALRDKRDADGDYNIGKYWRVISDGSLRNGGVELVCRKPVKEAELTVVLLALDSILKDETPEFSVRTSTHVHVNVRDMTLVQVIGLYMLYSAFEPVFQRYIRHERRFNLFCLPMGMCTEHVQKVMQHAVHAQSEAHGFERLANIGKYSSVNTGRVCDLGTIEFRAMHGADDLNRIQEWCGILSRLRSAALEFKTLDDVFMAVVGGAWEQYLAGVSSKELPGPTYCTVQQSINAAASILSSLKVAPTTEHRYRYVQSTGDLVADGRSAMTGGLTSPRPAFRSFAIPGEEVLRLAATVRPASYPFEYLDVVVLGPGTVAFKILRPDGKSEFTGVYQDTPQAELPIIKFIINRR